MSDELTTREVDDAEQMELALQGIKLYIDFSKPIRNYTAERVKRDRPDQYKAAVVLLARGFSFEGIKNRLGMDHRTVLAISRAEVTEVAAQREIARKEFFPVFMASMDQFAEEIPNMKGSQAAIGFGIAADKYQLLSGLPTANVEVNHHIDLGGELSKLMHEAKEAMKAAKATVVETANGGEGEPATLAIQNVEGAT